MQLVERHIIDRKDPRFPVLDQAAFLSKNLYNAANYQIRQSFILKGEYISYSRMDKLMQQSPDYCALPRKVSQWVLRQLHQDWKSFFEANKVYQKDPSVFAGKPKLPKDKHKTEGRNLLTYTRQAISRKLLSQGIVRPSQLDVEVKTKQKQIQQVRIAPKKTHYVIEVVYKWEPEKNDRLNQDWYAGIDLNLDNLAVVTSNKPGFTPVVVNGRPLKSNNQFYNKRRAELQSRLPVGASSRRLDRLTDKRNRRIDHDLHRASRFITDLLVQEQIGTLIVGKNPGWKQRINLGTRNNQSFVQIPHARFASMLQYKAEMAGIQFILHEESHTSKCSFLDLESIGHQEHYQGRRVHRGLFISSKGKRIQADVNGSYNIIRKAAPCAFTAAGVEGAVVRPVRIALTNYKTPFLDHIHICP
jgi:transposase, IS605 OrfB family, central region